MKGLMLVEELVALSRGRVGQFKVTKEVFEINSKAYRSNLLAHRFSPEYFQFTQMIIPEILSGGIGLRHLPGQMDTGKGLWSMIKSKLGVGDRNAVLRSGQIGVTDAMPVAFQGESFLLLGRSHCKGRRYFTGEEVENHSNDPVEFIRNAQVSIQQIVKAFDEGKTLGTLAFFPGSLNTYKSLEKEAFRFGEDLSFETSLAFAGVVGARTGIYDYHPFAFNALGVNAGRQGYQASIQASLVMHSWGKALRPTLPTTIVAHSWGCISFVAEYAKYMYSLHALGLKPREIVLPVNHVILADPRNPAWSQSEMKYAIQYLQSLGVVFTVIHDTKHFDKLNMFTETQLPYRTSHTGAMTEGVNFHTTVSTGHPVAGMREYILKGILRGLSAFQIQSYATPWKVGSRFQDAE